MMQGHCEYIVGTLRCLRRRCDRTFPFTVRHPQTYVWRQQGNPTLREAAMAKDSTAVTKLIELSQNKPLEIDLDGLFPEVHLHLRADDAG